MFFAVENQLQMKCVAFSIHTMLCYICLTSSLFFCHKIEIVEIPGYTLSWVAMNKIGRRWSLAGSLLLCAVTCVAGGFVHHGNIIKLF